jgi:2-oxo-4-hydroxy-4-carboxy--5-ureidoimidazoline (OHCU) decarboxylase
MAHLHNFYDDRFKVAFLAASATRQIDHAMARVAAEEREEEEAKAETEIEREEEVRWGVELVGLNAEQGALGEMASDYDWE